MIITVITVGTLKENYLKAAIAEYGKRISQYSKIEEIELKEERINDEDDHSEVGRALDAEATKILSNIPQGSYRVALCVEGKQYDSDGLAEIVRGAEDKSGKLTFIIGSSHGLSDRVKSACNERLSLSKLTFPHQLIRVNLYEAVYRSFSILRGKKYHK